MFLPLFAHKNTVSNYALFTFGMRWVYTEPVSCPYPPFCAASVRPPCGGRRQLWHFKMDLWALLPLQVCLVGRYLKILNVKTLQGMGAAASPHHLHTASARKLHELHTISMGRLQRLHGNCTEIARFPYNFRAASVWIYPGLTPRDRTRNGTMLVDNVNTYAVAHSHLRCPPKRTENHSFISKFVFWGLVKCKAVKYGIIKSGGVLLSKKFFLNVARFNDWRHQCGGLACLEVLRENDANSKCLVDWAWFSPLPSHVR